MNRSPLPINSSSPEQYSSPVGSPKNSVASSPIRQIDNTSQRSSPTSAKRQFAGRKQRTVLNLIVWSVVAFVILTSVWKPANNLHRRVLGTPSKSLSNNNGTTSIGSMTPPSSSFWSQISEISHKKPKKDGPWPRIAWLMSFPNSGTTYTLDLIRTVTQTTTASNYGKEKECELDENGHNVPLHPGNLTTGPFLHSLKLPLPTKYVLTKTHCGGRCVRCPPEKYLETDRSFLFHCRKGERVLDHTRESFEQAYYEPNLVYKAVHLIRNPLDNIVARLHYEHKVFEKRNKTKEFQTLYPSTPEGLQSWCQDMDTNFAHDERHTRWIDEPLIKLQQQRNVPCHHELYRYVQWHNLAFATTTNLGLEPYVLHYENYTMNLDQTVRFLLEYLEFPITKFELPPTFIQGKEYQHYFHPEDIEAVESYIRELASPVTWHYIQHYFTPKKIVNTKKKKVHTNQKYSA